jgi:hypothetical protein
MFLLLFDVYDFVVIKLCLISCVASNDRMILNAEWKRMWKETGRGYLRDCRNIYLDDL